MDDTTVRRIAMLQARLRDPNVTMDVIAELIKYQHVPHYGQVQQPLEQFMNEQDIKDLFALAAYWEPVPDKPKHLPTPRIQHYLMFINHTEGTKPISFATAMRNTYAKMLDYCKENEIDPTAIAEQNAKRTRKEQLAEARAHRTPTRSKVPDEQRAEYDRLQAEIDKATLYYDGLIGDKREEVLAHQQSMNAAAAERKALEAEKKSSILALKIKMRNLTAKR